MFLRGRIVQTCMFLFVCLPLIGCGSSSDLANAPDWLQAKVATLDIDSSVPFVVTRWQYNDATVYYFPPAMPDGLGCLYDVDGKVIGCPDGGMTGHGDGRCADFFSARSEEHVVWKP